jgi:small subunit ribosomal protein S2
MNNLKTIILVSFEDLMVFNVHLGHKYDKTQQNYLRFLSMLRKDLSIINLDITLFHLKRGFRFLIESVKNYMNSLIADQNNDYSYYVVKAGLHSDTPFIYLRWIPGNITNMFGLFKNRKKQSLNTKYKIYKKIQYLGINQQTFRNRPDVIFFLSSVRNLWGIFEANKFLLPILSIVDNDSIFDYIDYPIPGNDDSGKSIHLYCNIYKNSINLALCLRIVEFKDFINIIFLSKLNSI